MKRKQDSFRLDIVFCPSQCETGKLIRRNLTHGMAFSRSVQLSHSCDSQPSQVRWSDNQCRRFCAVLLGPPEEITLCALSTHYSLAAASFNPGTYTLLPRNAYVLTKLLLLCIVFFCHTHSTHGCPTLIECGFKSYPTMQLPSTS